jgi:argininosuccinate synthase
VHVYSDRAPDVPAPSFPEFALQALATTEKPRRSLRFGVSQVAATKGKLVLAYSGGLDTSVGIRWLKDKGWDVVALTVDLGEKKDLDAIQARALQIGASAAYVVDGRVPFLQHFVWPSLQAGAVYEKEYPLATALGRPLIAAQMVQIARQEGAKAIAHGCTGKGNDQVRFDVSTAALAPDLLVVAPVREWGMNRDDEIDYAREHGIPVPATAESPYSTDENLWGRSIEAGILEDPWAEPPPEVFEWTRDPRDCPAEPAYVEISFKKGLPTAIDGRPLDALEIVTRLNQLGGETGVGRIDHLENRLIGIKSREIYEAPAAVLLLQAHQALEDITLPKDVARFKDVVAQQWGQMVYDGLWFSPLRDALYAFVAETQRHVTGDVRLKLYRGSARVVGRKAPEQLYQLSLATYGKGDTFDQSAAAGFIKLWGQGVRTASEVQGQLHTRDLAGLLGEVKRLAP